MCGIMGYLGPRDAVPILLDGLRRLEYRGYDSAGIAVHDGSSLRVAKAEGKLDRLVAQLDDDPLTGSFGIGHTRWATHGPPSDRNAHPHGDPSGDVAVVHPGIIENFMELREELRASGHELQTETDTEVLVHLIEQHLASAGRGGTAPDLLHAVMEAAREVVGVHAMAVVSASEPGPRSAPGVPVARAKLLVSFGGGSLPEGPASARGPRGGKL